MKKIIHYYQFVRLFTPHQITFLNEHFKNVDQLFFVAFAPADYLAQAPENVRLSRRPDDPEFLKAARAADLVIFNGILDDRIPIYLANQTDILGKALWVIWGNDLYWHQYQPESAQIKIEMAFRRRFMADLHGVVSPIAVEYDLIQNWYPTRAKMIQASAFSYPFKREDLDRVLAPGPVYASPALQLGNSGNPSNEHMEMIDWFMPHRERIAGAYTPLSYGDKNHIQRVIRYGEAALGACFKPMTEILSFEDYNRHLAGLDVLVLNHRRVQGGGNTFISLYLGVKVFLRRELGSWDYLNETLGCRLFDAAAIPDLSFDEIISYSDELREHNRKCVSMLFDRQWQKANWEIVYAEPK